MTFDSEFWPMADHLMSAEVVVWQDQFSSICDQEFDCSLYREMEIIMIDSGRYSQKSAARRRVHEHSH